MFTWGGTHTCTKGGAHPHMLGEACRGGMTACWLHLVVTKHEALLERLRQGGIIWNESTVQSAIHSTVYTHTHTVCEGWGGGAVCESCV